MTRAIATFGQRAPIELPRVLGRAGAEVLSRAARIGDQGVEQLRHWSERRLVQVTILACAAMAVVRRTDAYAQARQNWRSAALAARRAWGRAEGFEVEASAGIALVVLAIVIVLHGFLTG
jgi:hypothetical protein